MTSRSATIRRSLVALAVAAALGLLLLWVFPRGTPATWSPSAFEPHKFAAGSRPEWAFSVTAGDWNQSGKLEILVADHKGEFRHGRYEWRDNRLAWVDNPIPWRCSLRTWVLDVNSDGLLDLVCDDNDLGSMAYLQAPLGTFTVSRSYCGKRCMQFMDFDGDGVADVLTREGKIISGTTLPVGRQLADDAVLATGDFPVAMIKLTKDAAPRLLTLSELPGAKRVKCFGHVNTNDFDGNGTTDVFMLNGCSSTDPGMPVLWLSDMKGQFTPTLPDGLEYRFGRYLTSYGNTSSADFDQDGDIDLLIAGDKKYHFVVFENLGNASFAAVRNMPFTPADPHKPYAIAADVNGDGWVDIVATSQARSGLQLLLNRHAGGSTG